MYAEWNAEDTHHWEHKMIKVEITDGNTTFLLSPHSIEIPDVRNMNESLQHEEQTCKMTAVFDVDLLSLLMNHADLQACVSDGETSLFTGFVDNNTDFTDNGEPEPADIINITIRDRTRLFDITTESEVAQIGKTLSQIVSVICQNCNVTNAAVFSDNPQVAAFVLDKDKKYLDALNTLLFQYGYTWFFNEDGEFEVLKINLQNVTESITDSDLFTGLNISKTRKNYNAIKVTYGTLTKKGNEQVFFTGNGLGGDNKVVPFTIRPGQYYPYESDPAQEQREGKVFQNFESGYAEEYTTYSGEKKFRRATNQTLIYTENHNVVEDWEGSIVINRTEYGARSAAVRLLNTGTKDAELKQFAIRADAYYRSSNNSVTVGSGKKEYSYEAEHIYDDTAASNLATLLSKLYTDTCIKFSGKIRRNIKPGTICSVDTGLSGITCNALVINSQYDPENDLHTITLNSISEVQMNSSRYKERKSENSLTENLALLDEAISDLKDGTANVGNPDLPTGILAVARKDDIYVIWTPPADNGLNNVIKQYIVEINKNDGDTWHRVTNVAPTAASYTFNRSIDYYPEAGTLAAWQVRITIENVYGKTATTEPQTININTYGTWIPVVPSLSKIPEENGINFEWPAPIGANSRTLYGSNQYELTVTYNDTDRPVITTSVLNAVYTFDRDSQVDGYPETIHDEEHTGLDLFSFKLKVINESGNFRQSNAQSFSSAETENYGTWIPVASSFIKRAAAEYGIDYEWTPATADGHIQLYGSNTYKLRVYCGNSLRATIEKGTLSAIYNFDRATDGYPEKQDVTGAAHTLDEYTATVEVINVSGNHATSQPAATIDTTYLGWKPDVPTITTRSSGRALTINPVNSEQRYGKIRYRYLINNLEKDGNNYYLPTPTADYLSSENNYRDTTNVNVPLVADSPYTQTMPLKGQNTTGYKLCSWEGAAAQDEYDEAEKKSITYSTTDPSTGQTTTTRTMDVNDVPETVKYWYDSTEHVHYASFETPMPDAVDTEYRFKVQAFNSVADNIASALSEPVAVTARATAAYDVVNGAITANALAPDAVTTDKIAAGSITAEKIFVRVLAAISANLGKITDGSLVGNANNYWYLSAPTEQGDTHHAGDFRVGGASGGDYIKCSTQDGTTYNIEIHASTFELTAVGTLIHGEFYVCDEGQALDANGRPTDYYAKITSSAIEMKKPVTISNNLSVGGSFSITNATHRTNATNELINSLTEGTSAPVDNDYYVAQYAGGGTTYTTYHRRPIKALFNYLKSKWTYRTEGTTSKIKININSTSNWMLCFTVTLYQGYRATKVMISGYQYGSNHWDQPEARLLGDSDGTETISVYFGYDSTNNLWVGFDGGNYTGVRISDVVNGYKAVSNWHSLFTISNVSSLATLQTTVTASSRANYAVSAGTSASCTGNSATATSAEKLTTARKVYVKLGTASTTETKDFSGDTAIPVNGTLPVANGGTGQSSLENVRVGNSRSANNIVAFGQYASLSSQNAITASLSKFALESGQAILLYMKNDTPSSNTVNVTLNVNATGAKTVVINGSNATKHVPAGLFIAQYDGTYWSLFPILNNSTANYWNDWDSSIGPDTDSFYGALNVKAWYFSWSQGYIVFSNGLKIQWGVSNSNVNLQLVEITTALKYNSASSYIVLLTREKTSDISSGGGAEMSSQAYRQDGSHFKIDQYKSTSHRTQWLTIGY